MEYWTKDTYRKMNYIAVLVEKMHRNEQLLLLSQSTLWILPKCLTNRTGNNHEIESENDRASKKTTLFY